MSVVGSVRERRRAETVQEIKAAALQQLAEGGAGEMSLRGVARAVGMTVQSLYHYFDSREALLDALVVDGHNGLTATVGESVEASRGRSKPERLIAAAGAYRAWALANRPAFLLLYGTPVPGYVARPDGPTGDAAYRLALPFVEVVFEGFTPEQLAAVPLRPEAGCLGKAELDNANLTLPIGALALFYDLRARMHGFVMLELLGHLVPLSGHGEELFRNAMSRAADDLARLHDTLARVGS